MRDWKALSRWTPEFFREEFGSLKFMIANQEKGQAQYKGGGDVEYTMAQLIDLVVQSTDENPAPYFRNQILYDLFPSLKEDIEPLPTYFQPNWLPERYFVQEVG